MLSYYARRLGAVFYDGLLLLAFWLLATFCLVVQSGRSLVVPHGGTLSRVPYWLFLLFIAWTFFGWFWSHGGQTLGMRAWKLQLKKTPQDDPGKTDPPDQAVGWRDASRRFVVALIVWLGVGALVIPQVWHITGEHHLHPGARIATLLGAWIAASLGVSLLPLARGQSIVDRLSRTRVVGTSP